jgi:ABC-type sugar transport system substrate-binding protein
MRYKIPMMSMSRLRAAVAVLGFALLAAAPLRAADEQTVEIVTRNGVHTFTVELAAT